MTPELSFYHYDAGSGDFTRPSLPMNMWRRIALALIDAGCIGLGYGDGDAVYSATGFALGDGTGAGNVSNTLAWFAVGAPDGSWGFSVQRGTTTTTGRIKIWQGGAPDYTDASATRVPTTTDEKVIYGGGTDASPTYATIAVGSTNQNVHIAVEEQAPYRWYAWNHRNGTSGDGIDFLCGVDVLAEGTYRDADTSPQVFLFSWTSQDATSWSQLSPTSSFLIHAWAKKGLSGATFQGWTALAENDGASGAGPWSMGPDPYTSKAALPRVRYGLREALATPGGLKGTSDMFRWNGDVDNKAGCRLQVDAAGDWLVLDDVGLCIPWDNHQVADLNGAAATATAEFALTDVYVTSDDEPPVLDNLSPEPGEDLAPDTLIEGDIHDADPGLSILTILAKISTETDEVVVYRDGEFRGRFADFSTIEGTGTPGDPYHFAIGQAGGWPRSRPRAEPVAVQLTFELVDGAGNVFTVGGP